MSKLFRVQFVRQAINDAHGTFFRINFTCKDGRNRSMLARTGVYKHTKSGKRFSTIQGNVFNPYMIVYSMEDKGYRSIYLSNVNSIQYAGKVVVFREA